ncbi:hypothetical protein HV782_000320 [Pseudomonas monsensis]|uniref:hypothetical protein n=1 Tax=Pseudomonas monsensis TaxID=2745509 RepID=UPI0016451B03|nr:hypothetical protein [Pseudomonas monsensis]QXI00473.1 hypothetical protein HV782_000320 [Pseudomonas monsensis]
MKKFLAVFLFCFPVYAYCEIKSESLCFVSVPDGKIKYELRTYSDDSTDWRGGFVKYKQSKQPISLVLSNIEREVLDPQAAVQLTRTWSEVLDGKVTGEYEMVSQGGIIVSMVYRKANGKEYSFRFDPTVDASEDGGCDWK